MAKIFSQSSTKNVGENSGCRGGTESFFSGSGVEVSSMQALVTEHHTKRSVMFVFQAPEKTRGANVPVCWNTSTRIQIAVTAFTIS